MRTANRPPEPAVRAGFTLIEIMVVTVIIAVLASIAIRYYTAARDRSLIATVQHDLHAIAIQQES